MEKKVNNALNISRKKVKHWGIQVPVDFSLLTPWIFPWFSASKKKCDPQSSQIEKADLPPLLIVIKCGE